MVKVSMEGAGKFSHHYPKVATIVTVHAGGKDNAMAVAWHSSISANPPIYGVSIAPKRFTLELMLEAKEFGVNFMPIDKAELVASVGGISGREVDKFQRWGIAKDKPLKTSVPILRDAYACYECKLIDHKTYGDHVWVVGEILATHFEERLFTERQALNLERVSPALFMGGDLYTIPAKDAIRHLDRKVYGKR
jgi:flavin reductase (DIM6/NTAB) family NADH-FMN oxidoreductase RutF